MTGTTANVTVFVRVQPNARKNAVIGFQDDVLRLKIAAPPVEGKANRELIVFLSEVLGVRKSDISIDKGETARRKTVVVTGISKKQALERFAHVSPHAPKLL